MIMFAQLRTDKPREILDPREMSNAVAALHVQQIDMLVFLLLRKT
jgi:hypothetical protein